MSFSVRNSEIETIIVYLGKIIKALLPEGWGFNLQIFSVGEKGEMFYISSAPKENMLEILQEFIDKTKPFREH